MNAPGIGHNRGPTLEPGAGWRRHCWGEARRALLPSLPLEVIRLRVARARQIGLDYGTYATVRATGGEDIVAFLFSTNALRIHAPADVLPADRATKLATIEACGRILLAVPPLDAEAIAQAIASRDAIRFEGVARGPSPIAPWRQIRREMRAAIAPLKRSPGAVMLVGEAGFEREWAGAARLAGYLPAERYFPRA